MTKQVLSHRDLKKAETRSHLVLMAHELFMKHGVSEIGMRKLAQVSGLGLGTYYNYFKTKDEIVFAISGELFSKAFKKKLKPKEGSSVDENLTAIVLGILKSLNKDSEIILQLVQIISNPNHYLDKSSEGRKFTEKFVESYSSMILDILPRESVRSDSSQVDFGRLCWHQLMIFIYMWFMDSSKGHKSTKVFIENTHKVLCYGIVK
ncbi:hypothetical protein A9Q84_07930 [Halobacteriovorax marinus]|uniref:HTH tetR-type domain-containing protein n=1 Tax=Halobacteriovorax marinus TaxID=97084 RepID=A0A1Y5F5V8_9BACT|nr:hypothetical protein A9Q84_07930 [Halobacteriovorax marinus]